MISMMNMKHSFIKALLPLVAATLATACSKNAGSNPNEDAQRYFDAWRAIHYPDAVERNGIYFIDDQPGNGLEWRESLPVTFLQYTMRNLDGTVAYNSDEQWAKQLGTWDQTYYYGPQVIMTGKGASYAGLDMLLTGMKQGGTRTAIIPSWMMTYDRYDTVAEYLDHETETSASIYTIKFLDQTENLVEYQYTTLLGYSTRMWEVSDTLSTGAVFFKSFTKFAGEPVEMPTDTTVYINYTGRRLDGQVFDTTIADTAKVHHIYNPSKTYAPVSISWAEKPADLKMDGSSSLIDGFKIGLHAMHAGEKASFAFDYRLGYSNSGSGNLIPPYASLRFDIELVPAP